MSISLLTSHPRDEKWCERGDTLAPRHDHTRSAGCNRAMTSRSRPRSLGPGMQDIQHTAPRTPGGTCHVPTRDIHRPPTATTCHAQPPRPSLVTCHFGHVHSRLISHAAESLHSCLCTISSSRDAVCLATAAGRRYTCARAGSTTRAVPGAPPPRQHTNRKSFACDASSRPPPCTPRNAAVREGPHATQPAAF